MDGELIYSYSKGLPKSQLYFNIIVGNMVLVINCACSAWVE